MLLTQYRLVWDGQQGVQLSGVGEWCPAHIDRIGAFKFLCRGVKKPKVLDQGKEFLQISCWSRDYTYLARPEHKGFKRCSGTPVLSKLWLCTAEHVESRYMDLYLGVRTRVALPVASHVTLE